MKALLCEFYGLSWTNKQIDTRPNESLIFLLLLFYSTHESIWLIQGAPPKIEEKYDPEFPLISYFEGGFLILTQFCRCQKFNHNNLHNSNE